MCRYIMVHVEPESLKSLCRYIMVHVEPESLKSLCRLLTDEENKSEELSVLFVGSKNCVSEVFLFVSRV